MQSLWTRVAQKGSCRCPQCLSHLGGVSRRAAGTATRRAPKYLTSSTLWYSGIFAVATTLDATIKIQRREKWDHAIAEARQELGLEKDEDVEHARECMDDLGLDELQVKQAEDTGIALQPQTHGEGIEQLSHNVPGSSLLHTDEFDEVQPAPRRPRWPTNTGPPLHVHHLAPESIYATADRKERAASKRWSPKKVEIMNVTMDLMQVQFFQLLAVREWSEEAAAAVAAPEYSARILRPLQELNIAEEQKLDELKILHQQDWQLTGYNREGSTWSTSSYQQDDSGHFQSTVRELNLSLQDLFRLHSRNSLSTPALLAKLSHNISMSFAPPDVETFNTLLIGLGRLKDGEVTQLVISSLRTSNVRPNEVTLNRILKHYIDGNDPKRFAYWVGLICGRHNGLALARPDILINSAAEGRLVRRPGREDKVIQKPYPTPKVFGPLIEGVLKFVGFDKALGICRGMGQQGWGLSMSGFMPLLEDCVNRRDWASGTAVWEQIKALHARSQADQRPGQRGEQIQGKTFEHMLQLCSACGKRDVFNEVMRHAESTGYCVDDMLLGLRRRLAREGRVAASKASSLGRPSGQEEAAAVGQESRSEQGRSGFVPPKLVSSESEPIQDQLESLTARPTNWAPTDGKVTRDQLNGLVPAGHHLDAYEARERPMSLC